MTGCLPAPLKWNESRTWAFNIVFNTSKIYLLKDHVIAIKDLISDFGSGPAVKLEYFIPYTYTLTITAKTASVLLSLNDNNIINIPNSLDDNVFIVLDSQALEVSFAIPFEKYETVKRKLDFDLAVSLEFFV